MFEMSSLGCVEHLGALLRCASHRLHSGRSSRSVDGLQSLPSTENPTAPGIGMSASVSATTQERYRAAPRRRPQAFPPPKRHLFRGAVRLRSRIYQHRHDRDSERTGSYGGSSRRDYMWEILSILWPSPAQTIRIGRKRPGAPGTIDFIVVPNEHRVTLLIPRRPAAASAASMRNYKTSATPVERIRIRAFAMALRLGGAEIFPNRVRIDRASGTPDQDITTHLKNALGRSFVASLYIGPPRANRKPILQLITQEGHTFAFAKVGINALTNRLIRVEAGALEQLKAVELRFLETPTVLYDGTWRDRAILVQRALPASSLHVPPIRATFAAMNELARAFEVTIFAADQSPYWNTLGERLALLRNRDYADSLSELFETFERARPGIDAEFGSWHGDWTPWNMTMHDDRANVWDWERFETGVPIGFDGVHYRLQEAITRHEVTPLVAARRVLREAPRWLPEFGVDSRAAELVAILYLFEIGTRYAHDDQAEAGAQLGRLDTWLLPALAEHIGRLGEGTLR